MKEDRPVSLTQAAALVVANMIGTGIFTTPGLLLEQLQSPLWVLAVWLVGGLLALAGADVYAELGAMMPRAGGEYVYLRRAFHPAVGFLSGWVSLIVGFSAPIAASAVAFGSYLHAVASGIPATGAAVALVVSATVLHMASVTWGSRVQTVFTLLKVLILVVLILGAFTVGGGSWAHYSTADEGPESAGAVAVALIFASFAYSGWNGAAYIAGEIRRPGRNLPRALVGGTLLVTVLYVVLNVVFFYSAPAADLSGRVEVGHIAARALFGETAGNVLSLLIAVALVSSVSAMVMAGPRIYMAMAEDGVFFRALARRGASGAPWVSVALQGLLATVLALTATFETLLLYIGFTLSLFAALTVLAAFVLRRRAPEAKRPYRARGWPVTPAAFFALSVWMVTWSVVERPVASLAGLATLAAGLGVYAVWPRPDPE